MVVVVRVVQVVHHWSTELSLGEPADDAVCHAAGQLESISLSMSNRWFLKGWRRNAVRLAEAEAEGLWFPSGIHQSRIDWLGHVCGRTMTMDSELNPSVPH